jgi:hypothetical protein
MDVSVRLTCAVVAALALIASASASSQTVPQAKATFRTCLLNHGAVKVTLPRGSMTLRGSTGNGHFWFRRPVKSRWDEHSGWWGVVVWRVNRRAHYGIAYQIGGMSGREWRLLARCADRV